MQAECLSSRGLGWPATSRVIVCSPRLFAIVFPSGRNKNGLTFWWKWVLGRSNRRIHANAESEGWVLLRFWRSRHLQVDKLFFLKYWNSQWLLVIICRNIPSPFTTISDLWVHFIIPSTSPAWRNWLYQGLTWSPTRSFFKTSCGTLHPHPFRSVNLVNLHTTNMNLYLSCKVQVDVGFSYFWFVPTWCAINEWLRLLVNIRASH